MRTNLCTRVQHSMELPTPPPYQSLPFHLCLDTACVKNEKTRKMIQKRMMHHARSLGIINPALPLSPAYCITYSQAIREFRTSQSPVGIFPIQYAIPRSDHTNITPPEGNLPTYNNWHFAALIYRKSTPTEKATLWFFQPYRPHTPYHHTVPKNEYIPQAVRDFAKLLGIPRITALRGHQQAGQHTCVQHTLQFIDSVWNNVHLPDPNEGQVIYL